jgi:ribosomal protein S12 methylthiotransferase accessory factor
MTPHMDFIMRTAKIREITPDTDAPSARESLEGCLAEIQRAGLEAVVVDLTTPEIAELGFHVPKVMVPGLAVLSATHVLPSLATPRYQEVPVRLGLTDPIHRLFNPAPHPFP